MKTNLKMQSPTLRTHEGAPAVATDAATMLRRSVMSCMLWEREFYEDGEAIAERITRLVAAVEPAVVRDIAIEARTGMKLRHAPLLLALAMCRLPSHRREVGATLAGIVQRPDEIGEFLSMYWGGPSRTSPVAAQVKKGLMAALAKFNEYSLAKWDQNSAAVRIRDALFLAHGKPADGRRGFTKEARRTERRLKATPILRAQEALYRAVADDQLATPDTWEVALSGGADKRETFVRLMAERKLPAMACLRNLRNMEQAGIAKAIVGDYLRSLNLGRVLPFRFIAAARMVPMWEDMIEEAMLRCLAEMPKWPGRSVLLIDGSGSMQEKVSAKSDISRRDAAIALAILMRELCEEVRVICFSTLPWDIPPRRGFALREAIEARVVPEATMLGKAVRHAQASFPHDRCLVITDEQSADRPPAPMGLGIIVNVASYQNGVGHGAWQTISGWSEKVIEYARALEGSAVAEEVDPEAA